MLDFVPNHTALDHPWVSRHPDFYVQGDEQALAAAPADYCRVATDQGARILAHGRDPNFPGWPDTLQLNYANPTLQAALMAELAMIAEHCDGLRCDMAMLVLPDVFRRSWGLDTAGVLAEGDRGSARSSSRLHVSGWGILGFGVGVAAAGLRLLLRQASL